MHSQRLKSFVCRAGRMSATQKEALARLLPKYALDQAFWESAPVVLELGFGMGHTLLEMARTMPQKNFIGIEVHRPGLGSVLARAEQEGLRNLRVLAGDGVEILAEQIPDHSLAEICIFFPDPWPKSRHHKRRLIQEPFVEVLARKLVPGGKLRLATDWEDYAKDMQSVLAANPAFTRSEEVPYRPQSKFEAKSQAAGRQVWDLVYLRTTEPSVLLYPLVAVDTRHQN